VPTAEPLEVLVLGAAAWALVALAALWSRTRSYGRRVLFAPAAGDGAAGVRYAFTKGMLPSAKESVRMHLPSYVAGLAFHAGVFVAMGLLAASVAGIDLGGLAVRSARIATAVGALAGLGLLGKRIASPHLRGLSSPDDFVANVLTTTFTALAAFASFDPRARPAWLVAAALLLLYVPVGKIRHCFLFFPSRYHLGLFFGRRGTFPPASRREA
jgi:hypothetical protein